MKCEKCGDEMKDNVVSLLSKINKISHHGFELSIS